MILLGSSKKDEKSEKNRARFFRRRKIERFLKVIFSEDDA